MSENKIIALDEVKYDTTSKYDINKYGKKGKRVGQAVYDILLKDQPNYTTEDILDGYSVEFVKEIESCIENNKNRYESPFYILVLSHKEPWADNVVRNWFIARQTAPDALDMIKSYSNHMKTLYRVDKVGRLELDWVIPGIQDIRTILKNPHLYDPQLVKYCTLPFGIKIDI